MLVTILGCGTSVGVPMIGQVKAHHADPKNCRLRASILIEPLGRGGPAVLVDTSPDLRQQVLRFFPAKNPRLDAVLMTHEHADHLHGIDDIRPFNFLQKKQIPFYGDEHTMKSIEDRFSYIFFPTQVGGGLPQLSLHRIANRPFTIPLEWQGKRGNLPVQPLPLIHGKVACLGFRIGGLAYITDCSEIPDSTLALLNDLDVLILDCLRFRAHPTHLTVEQSLDYAKRIASRRTIFTHMGSEIEYYRFQSSLPRGMAPAFDGMRVKLESPLVK